MTPSDLALPPKFVSWRRGQEQLILDAAASSKRFTLISAPPGSGKSVTYISLAQLLASDGRTLVLTHTKGLQEQLLADFSSLGMRDIRGLANYRCIAVDKGGALEEFGGPYPTMCSDGPCRVGVECTLKQGGCAYYDDVGRALEARIVVTNYAYWMSVNRYAEQGRLGNFDLGVMDEAHAAPAALAEFCSVALDRAEVRALFSLSMPDAGDDIETWREWAAEAVKRAVAAWRECRNELELARGADRRRLARRLRTIADLGRGLREISASPKWKRTDAADVDVRIAGAQTDWVILRTDTGVKFSPVWGHAYAEPYLFSGIKRIVLSSATLHPRTARDLGITDSAYDFFESQAAFAPARRKLYYIPTTNVDQGMTEGQRRIWLNRIDAVVGARLDRAGIIHTRSYERARYIMERSQHRQIMLSHTTKTTREVVEEYVRRAERGQPVVLVSPSLTEGYDFRHSRCRYQILAKVPFADKTDPMTAARARTDKSYVNSLAAEAIEQQVGRGTRADDDWCESFIIDDHFDWFWPAARKQGLFHRWFMAAYEQRATIPDPPPLSTGPTFIDRPAAEYEVTVAPSGIKRRTRTTAQLAAEFEKRRKK